MVTVQQSFLRAVFTMFQHLNQEWDFIEWSGDTLFMHTPEGARMEAIEFEAGSDIRYLFTFIESHLLLEEVPPFEASW